MHLIHMLYTKENFHYLLLNKQYLTKNIIVQKKLAFLKKMVYNLAKRNSKAIERGEKEYGHYRCS